MQINTDGLIIREQSIGESDRLVTVLTREQGILRAFVRGAKAIDVYKRQGQNPQLGLKRGTQPLERGFKHYYFT